MALCAFALLLTGCNTGNGIVTVASTQAAIRVVNLIPNALTLREHLGHATELIDSLLGLSPTGRIQLGHQGFELGQRVDGGQGSPDLAAHRVAGQVPTRVLAQVAQALFDRNQRSRQPFARIGFADERVEKGRLAHVGSSHNRDRGFFGCR